MVCNPYKKAVDKFRPDLFITTEWAYRQQKRRYIEELMEKAEKYNVSKLYWATEDPRWTKECSLKCLEVFRPDVVLNIHPRSVKIYWSLGIRAVHLDFGCNPEFNKTERMQ